MSESRLEHESRHDIEDHEPSCFSSVLASHFHDPVTQPSKRIKLDFADHAIPPFHSQDRPSCPLPRYKADANKLTMLAVSSHNSAPSKGESLDEYIDLWVATCPSSTFASTLAQGGFLALPGEIRTIIYEHLIDLEDEVRYEIKTLEVENDRYIAEVQHKHVIHYLSATGELDSCDVDATVKSLNRVREDEGRDTITTVMPASVMAWRWRSSGQLQGPLSDLEPVRTWGHVDVLSDECRTHFDRLVQARSAVALRRHISRGRTADDRNAVYQLGGDGYLGIAALGLCCTTTAEEFLPMLYARLHFGFSAAQPTIVFLRHLRPNTAVALTVISLHHHMELRGPRGDCAAPESEQDWARSCQAITWKAPSLRDLTVVIDVRGSGASVGQFPPRGAWTDFFDTERMETAPWFSPLRVFRDSPCLERIDITYQPCPRRHRCSWAIRVPMSRAFERLFRIGPERLREEYDAGLHDGLLAACGKATDQRFPTLGPLTLPETMRRWYEEEGDWSGGLASEWRDARHLAGVEEEP